jgi:hypothetical protein
MTFIRSHIVSVFGPPRSGKDTLIGMLRDKLEEGEGVFHIHLSSIVVVKDFLEHVENVLGYTDDIDFTTPDKRQALSEIKAVLDKQYNWTVLLALKTARHGSPLVLFYQVRELANIRTIDEECRKHNIGHTTLCVYRPVALEVAATSEQYDLGEMAKTADVFVNNAKLEELPAWTDLICARIIARMKEGRD